MLCNVQFCVYKLNVSHSELRQTFHAVKFLAGCHRGLLSWRFTVQVVVGQSLNRTDPLSYPSFHLVFGNGQIQVLSLEHDMKDSVTFLKKV